MFEHMKVARFATCAYIKGAFWTDMHGRLFLTTSHDLGWGLSGNKSEVELANFANLQGFVDAFNEASAKRDFHGLAGEFSFMPDRTPQYNRVEWTIQRLGSAVKVTFAFEHPGHYPDTYSFFFDWRHVFQVNGLLKFLEERISEQQKALS